MKSSILGLGIAVVIIACGASEVQLRGGAYGANLEECNRNAKNLCQSIDCENHYRAKEGRFLRTVPAHCLDAGKEWTTDGAPSSD